jgi:hypothetical protein
MKSKKEAKTKTDTINNEGNVRLYNKRISSLVAASGARPMNSEESKELDEIVKKLLDAQKG